MNKCIKYLNCINHLRILVTVVTCVVVTTALNPSIALAELSLAQAVNDQLQMLGEPCANLLNGDNGGVVLMGGLQEICARAVPVGSQASTQSPSAGNTLSLINSAQTLLQYSSEDKNALNIPLGNWSLFANIEHDGINHDSTALTDAFDVSATRINAGVNYQLNTNSHLGFALVGQDQQGNFQQGGDFSSASIGLRILANITLGQQGFLELLAGQNATSTDRNRVANFEDTFNGVALFTRSGTPTSKFKYHENEVAAVVGTHLQFASLVITPSLSLNLQKTNFGTYSELGESGLELTTHNDATKALQAAIGAQVEKVIPTSWGVLMPQLAASLISEFENKSRKVSVSFTGDTRAKQFSYDTEPGDAQYLAFSGGSVFLVKNGVQFYFNVSFYAAYENYNRSLISGGVRWEL